MKDFIKFILILIFMPLIFLGACVAVGILVFLAYAVVMCIFSLIANGLWWLIVLLIILFILVKAAD